MKPLVSIITPTYNNPEELLRAIASVEKQSYKNIELIIVNDGSSAEYSSVLEHLKKIKGFKVIYIEQENNGPGVARQNGLQNSNGKYIQYLDSDDELLPDKLEKQVKVFEKYPESLMVYGLSQINNDPDNIHRIKHFKGDEDNVIISAIEKRKWHTSACLWNYDKSKEYWENLFNGEDVLHDINAGLYNKNKNVKFLNEICCNINFETNNTKHLSNALHDKKKVGRVVKGAIELNTRIKNKLFDFKLTGKEYLNPLAERFLFEGLKVFKYGYKKEGIKSVKEAAVLSKSLLKKIEIYAIMFLIRSGIVKSNGITNLFRLHRMLNSPKTHQFRSL